MISDADKERVRQHSDLLEIVSETVELRQRGSDFWGCCPFHHEKSPSFHVIPATGLWKCFGCGAGGDVFAYIMKRENLDFADSIRYLADRAGIELLEERAQGPRGPKKNRLIECMELSQEFFETQLMRGKGQASDAARAYFASRGFSSQICKKWHLGYAPGYGKLVQALAAKGFSSQEMEAADVCIIKGGVPRDRFYERVIFPIHDEQGRTIAFGGRVLGDAKPKYLNTKDTPIFSKGRHLFAFDVAKEHITSTGNAIVCEGYTDVIAMHEAGFTNTVATLGTALTQDHIKLIERFAKRKIICMFDGDSAGQKAAERAIQFIDKTRLELMCCVLPGGMDPMEYLSAHTPAQMQEELDRAQPLMSFVFEKRLSEYDFMIPGQRVRALRDMAQLLAPLDGSLVLDSYATQLADLVGADVTEVKKAIHAHAQKRAHSQNSYRKDMSRTLQREEQKGELPSQFFAHETPQSFDNLALLSTDVRMQTTAERELLALIATHPQLMHDYETRFTNINWSNETYQAMAWAMLALPKTATPAEVAQAAQGIAPQAAEVLASARLEAISRMEPREQAAFLLDVVELWSNRQEIKKIKAALASQSTNLQSQEGRELLERATALQKNVNEITKHLSRVSK